jgi:DNA-binding IclR family transcriptional regulator
MLAFQPPPWPEEFLARARLTPSNHSSITDRRALRRAVAKIRDQGYAVTLGEATEGVVGIAAPVFDASGQVVAAIVLAAPMARAEPRLVGLARRVCQAGRELSRRLGYRTRQGRKSKED